MHAPAVSAENKCPARLGIPPPLPIPRRADSETGCRRASTNRRHRSRGLARPRGSATITPVRWARNRRTETVSSTRRARSSRRGADVRSASSNTASIQSRRAVAAPFAENLRSCCQFLQHIILLAHSTKTYQHIPHKGQRRYKRCSSSTPKTSFPYGLRPAPNHAEALHAIRWRVAEAASGGRPIVWVRHHSRPDESRAFVPGSWGAACLAGLAAPEAPGESFIESAVPTAAVGTCSRRSAPTRSSSRLLHAYGVRRPA